MRKEDDGLDQSALKDDAGLQQWKSKFNAVAPRLNYTAAEQAGAKVPVRRDQNKRNRDAEGEAGEGVQARQVKRQLCEDCQETTTSYGLPEEGRRRWCEPCSRLHAGAISLIRRNLKPAGANKRKAAASKASHPKRGQGQERGAFDFRLHQQEKMIKLQHEKQVQPQACAHPSCSLTPHPRTQASTHTRTQRAKGPPCTRPRARPGACTRPRTRPHTAHAPGGPSPCCESDS